MKNRRTQGPADSVHSAVSCVSRPPRKRGQPAGTFTFSVSWTAGSWVP
jgi:hypothetical protein